RLVPGPVPPPGTIASEIPPWLPTRRRGAGRVDPLPPAAPPRRLLLRLQIGETGATPQAAALRVPGLDQPAEEQVEQGDVVVQRGLVRIHEVLHREPHVERDHRRCELPGWQWRLAAELLERRPDLLCQHGAIAAPEGRRQLAELLVPRGLSQALEPKPEQPPAGLLLLLHVTDSLDPPAQLLPRCAGLPLTLLRELRVSVIDPRMQQLDEKLVLALEVG